MGILQYTTQCNDETIERKAIDFRFESGRLKFVSWMEGLSPIGTIVCQVELLGEVSSEAITFIGEWLNKVGCQFESR